MINDIKSKINSVMGKTIAIVYIFEGDNSSGFQHFYIWKSKIIAKWMEAVQELKGMPLIMDVRTFVDKAMSNTLPHIDYVINLNSGTYSLSTMALVPSVCSAINVPCIPCNATTIVSGEEKNLSNYIAMGIGLNVPEYIPDDNPDGIFRPINLGNSMGVVKGSVPQGQNGIYQKFIPGYDITTPLVYNAVSRQIDIMPTVVFYPTTEQKSWFYDENAKHQQSGYTFKKIYLDNKIQEYYIKLANIMGIKTFCRIDARVKHFYELGGKLNAHFDETFFIEINVMPTVRDNNSFHYSFNNINEGDSLYCYVSEFRKYIENPTINTFLLTSSMLSFT